MDETPIYKQIPYFIQNYGKSGNPDQRNIIDFLECETGESIRSLQNELIGVTHGNFSPEIMDKLIGLDRKSKFKSYEEWAKMMIMWIAGFKH